MGDRIYDRCPGMDITNETRQHYALFRMAYSFTFGPSGATIHRHISFTEMMDLPMQIAQAFQAIESELYQIGSELKSKRP